MAYDEAEIPETAALHHRTAGGESIGATPGRGRRILLRVLAIFILLLIVVATVTFFAAHRWADHAMRDSLPQLDGTLPIPGLSGPVTVQRDSQGVPHIRAASLDDLIIAQGFVTAQDRLWQMDSLRRFVTGNMAEVLGASLVPHDRLQRTLQITTAADHAIAVLPPDQVHFLELYARGVNASIEVQRAHLPLEFRILRYQPAPWTPRDSVAVGIVLFQDLTTTFPEQLGREALTAKLPPELVSDLYPVGSWRDHPPAQPTVDLTAPQTDIPDIPLDETQSKLTPPNPTSPTTNPGATQDLLALQQSLKDPACEACIAGSNNWAVSGAHTATGKPLLSNDMHLSHSVPGIWYQADLKAPTSSGEFHVAGVSLPGVPFIIVGHNAHIAWGFTNLGAEVQAVSIEHTRGTGATAEYQSADNTWHPLIHQKEIIHVRNSSDIVLDVTAVQHGNITAPIISDVLPSETRPLSLRWTIYDPSNITAPFFSVNSAADWTSFTTAFSTFGGPSQNVVYADDQGHIGYHAVGKIPIRGDVAKPSPISPVPTDALDATQDWAGYIPFDQLPQSFDPPSGLLATANSRVTTDIYPYPITLNWASPYRNERIWKVLGAKEHLTPADMLTLQTDIYSDVDHVIAQRLAYAVDNSTTLGKSPDAKRLHQAADLLRNWNGNVDADAPAPAIVDAFRAALWPLLLDPHLGPSPGNSAQLYTWGEKPYAEEWLIMHTPSRWLSKSYATWDDLLIAALRKGLADAHAPVDLTKWSYGTASPVDIEHPIYSQSPILQRVIGIPTGTGIHPQSGDTTTVKQVNRTFGPSERFTADLDNLDNSTLNLVLGESANPLSSWFMSQWPYWYNGTTLPMPFTQAAVDEKTTHTLTLTPH